MMRKFNFKTITAFVFISFIIITGILTLTVNFKMVFGGLYRGYVNTNKDAGINEKIVNSLKEFDNRTSIYYIAHDYCIDCYGAIQNALKRTYTEDVSTDYSVLKLNNDYLTFHHISSQQKPDEITENRFADYLSCMNDVCKSYSGNLCYVSVTDKLGNDTSQFPKNLPFEKSIDNTINEIEERNVSVLDINKKIEEQYNDRYSLYFKTDHHWKPSTGIWVAGEIAEKLNSDFGYSIDLANYDIANYNIETYHNHFLGTEGTRMGKLYVGKEDFDVITPKFDTNLNYIVEESNIHKIGTFKETMIFEDVIKDKLSTPYKTYMFGNHGILNIINNNVNNDKKALIVMNSYGCVVAPYLSLSFKQTDCIDIRDTDKNVIEYIKETEPDIVIYMISYTTQY